MVPASSHQYRSRRAGLARGLGALPVLIWLALVGGCSEFGPTYQASTKGGALRLHVAGSSLTFDAALTLALVLLTIFYNALRKKLTPGEELEFLTMGRILAAVMAAFVAIRLLYPHWVFEIRVDEQGVSERTALRELLIPWNEMVAVRNNLWRKLPTPDGIVQMPRLEIVGSHDDFIYIEKKEIGDGAYNRLTTEVGRRYYGRSELTGPSPAGPSPPVAPADDSG